MDLASVAIAVALAAPPGRDMPLDFDPEARAAHESIDSPYLQDMTMVAMALPYKYGVTQMPCKAREYQPLRGWTPAREPSGRIEWLEGAASSVRWSGIYGICYISSPVPRAELGSIERTALECECNGWLPKGVAEIPLP